MKQRWYHRWKVTCYLLLPDNKRFEYQPKFFFSYCSALKFQEALHRSFAPGAIRSGLKAVYKEKR